MRVHKIKPRKAINQTCRGQEGKGHGAKHDRVNEASCNAKSSLMMLDMSRWCRALNEYT